MGDDLKFIADDEEHSSFVKALRKTDPVFAELIADYQLLLRDLEAQEASSEPTYERFRRDANDSLQALDQEIRERLSKSLKTKNI